MSLTTKTLLGVALVSAALFLSGLGGAPFVDPPEGFHAAIARDTQRLGDWITPHINGVRYFDKPRLVKPDLLFVLCLLLAFAGFVAAYLERGRDRRARWALLLFYAGLAGSVLAKDVLGAVVPLVILAVFFVVTGERGIVRRWVPWAGVLLFLLIAAPWYVLVELRNPGFLWYTVVDNHILNVARQRVFPDEDVPLGTLVRSVRGLAQAVALRAAPADILVHEGALENTGSWLMDLDRPVKVVNGLISNLAFGAAFPEARDIFWGAARLEAAWTAAGRVF